MVEWAVMIRAVAGEVEFVTKLPISNTLGEAVANFCCNRRHVYIQTFAFSIDCNVARRDTVRVRQ
jgi:hypothetical protein